MGDNNSKWEPVGHSDLKHGDRARITNAKGDVIYGCMEGERFICDFGDVGAWALSETGYSFERAVPERTLPSEPGVYLNPARHLDKFDSVFTLTTSGHWTNDRAQDIDDTDVPADLVRLVPVTEVEEAEKRIQAVRDYIGDRTGTYIDSGTAAAIFDILDRDAS